MQTVLITGGARGVGLALSHIYEAAGFHVIATVRNIAEAQKLLPKAELIECEVTDPASVANLQKQMQGKVIDVLINNAGILGSDRQTSTDMDFDGFLEILAVNTVAPLRIVQVVLPALKRAKQAKVATISSNIGSFSTASSDRMAYRASKAAANKIVQCLATDFRPMGIAVASLHPGWVKTDMGGSSADITPTISAKGIKSVMDKLTISTTGRFWNYDGGELKW